MTDGRADIRTDGRMTDGRVEGRTDGWMAGRIERLIDGRMDRSMDEWMECGTAPTASYKLQLEGFPFPCGGAS